MEERLISVPLTITATCDRDTTALHRSPVLGHNVSGCDTVPLRSFFGEDYRVQAVVCWTQNWRAPGSVPDCPAHNSILNERTNEQRDLD